MRMPIDNKVNASATKEVWPAMAADTSNEKHKQKYDLASDAARDWMQATGYVDSLRNLGGITEGVRLYRRHLDQGPSMNRGSALSVLRGGGTRFHLCLKVSAPASPLKK
jgi:hypothetical protein